MRNVFVLALMSICALAGCQQEIAEYYEPDNDMRKVHASLEDSFDTKTSMNDKEVHWSSGDQITVFMKNTLRKRFCITAESVGSKQATFLYDSDYILSGHNVQVSNNIAYYPFSEVTCMPDGESYVIDNVTLPETQSYIPGSFGEESFPMVAVTKDIEDVDFAFRNVCGVLAFQLKGSGVVKSITIKGNSEEVLAGRALIVAAFEKSPEISLLTDGSKAVTLDCGEAGVELKNEKPTSFFISLPPVVFENGFTITVTDIKGRTEDYSTTRKNVILRSGILRMPVKEYLGMNTSIDNDYIDEYGVNHGPGVEIDGVIWAPVNCGYHEPDFKYGKLYQWGRKYGQGYDGDLYDEKHNSLGTYSDSVVPIVKPGPVSMSTGQDASSEIYFYYNTLTFRWISSVDEKLWNLGTEDNPVKTEYDPCPEGWRVPTCAELIHLKSHKSSWTTNDGQVGYWFSGSEPYSSNAARTFFPAAGLRYNSGGAKYRGSHGYYWSSQCAYDIHFDWTGCPYGWGGSAYGYSLRCVKDDGELIPVADLILDTTLLSLNRNETYTLSSTFSPSNATHQVVHWSSAETSIATVDQNGTITAVLPGNTTITAMIGMQTATCQVTVNGETTPDDYIDEYGVNHGPGVEIDGVVWAPVNCGYHRDNFKYGKLYQWGRKYGQGYDGKIYDVNGSKVGSYSDAYIPRIRSGPVPLSTGNSATNENDFYYNTSSPHDWLSSPDDKLWNSGTEDNPVKTEYDPCPEGWRVPTCAELTALKANRSSWTTYNDQVGYWLSGSNSYTEIATRVFLPAAGRLYYYGGSSYERGEGCYYWSSLASIDYAFGLILKSDLSSMYDSNNRAYGYSVRCVKQ